LIRGAAGSGKTSTALTALRASTGSVVNVLRNADQLPAKVLVLTYNNSLKGYVSTVARDELSDLAADVQLYVETFDKWAHRSLGWAGLDIREAENKLLQLAAPFPRDRTFVLDEVRYVLGRFSEAELGQYPSCQRTGRGNSPAMPALVRQRLLDEVIKPYIEWKTSSGVRDFTDLANAMALADPEVTYDVIVVDEAQDLSAIQLRCVARHSAPDAAITIVTDTAQRIYPRGTVWAETGLPVTANRSFRLTQNYRNTREIASLAASVANGLLVDDDGSIPNPTLCTRSGEKPTFIWGTFPEQAEWVVGKLKAIDLEQETVGFLHLKGGGWFDCLRSTLTDNGLDFCELQGVGTWPEHGSNIGISTFHSAKGLEFDHVFMIGLTQQNASYGEGDDDDRLLSLRRLVTMGIGRARNSLVVGMERGDELRLLDDIDRSLIDEIEL
jgi:superfamily I DNA/RNA helicase